MRHSFDAGVCSCAIALMQGIAMFTHQQHRLQRSSPRLLVQFSKVLSHTEPLAVEGV